MLETTALHALKQRFERQHGQEINNLLLHMYTCSWPINIHLDGFISLSSVYMVAIFKVWFCFNGKLCNEFNGVKLDVTFHHSLRTCLLSGFYKPA